MAERDLFEHRRPLAGGGSLSCEDWEILLAEELDKLLPAEKRAAFEAHSAACPVCAELLEQSRQGQEWLQFLETEPEVPVGMVARIVGKTSGAAARSPLALGGGAIPATPHMLSLPVRRVMWDSRMLMTAAMAFFSIALTLNLAGVRLTNLRLADLTPASLEMNLTRQFYGAKGSVVRYYDNLRLVYEVESRMRDLRRSEQMRQAAPERQAVPANPSGNGHKNGGRLEPSTKVPSHVPVNGALWGSPELASAGSDSIVWKEQENFNETEQEVTGLAVFWVPVQAEGGLA
ncbi:MAG: hypothetical protein WBD10_00450 [Acidobacteriaceae bacterium]